MSSDQIKIARVQDKLKKHKDVRRISDKKEVLYFKGRLNYPEIYGEMPQNVIDKLNAYGIFKRKKHDNGTNERTSNPTRCEEL